MKKWTNFIASFLVVIFCSQCVLDYSIFNDGKVNAGIIEMVSAPTNLRKLNVEEEAVSLEWDKPKDSDNITGYEIYQNGSYVQTVKNDYCRVGHLSSNTLYSFSVKAVNEEGDKSSSSNTIQVVTKSRANENTYNNLQEVSTDDLNANDKVEEYSSNGDEYIIPNVSYVSNEVVDTESPSAPTDLMIISKTDTTISISWTASRDNIGVKSYEIYNNDDLLGETSGTVYILKNLVPKQTYNLKVKAKDLAGNISSESNTLIVTTDEAGSLLDQEAPTVPSNLIVNSKNETTVELSWDASTDNDEVQLYYIYNGEVVVGKSETNSFTVTNLDPNTTYYFAVKAADKTGNISEKSSEVSVTTDIDVTAPSKPNNFKVDSKTATSVTLAWDKSEDNVAIEGYDIYIDDEKVGFTSNNTITITGLIPNTVNKYRILARDTSGNVSDFTESIEFTTDVDTDIPTKPINLSYSNVSVSSITLTWDSSYDNVAVTGYEIYLGDEKVGETTDTTYVVTNLNKNTEYTFYVKAIDGAGNISEASDSIKVSTYNDDYGNSISDAFEIQENIDVTGELNYSSDIDYFYFVTGESGKYSIQSLSSLDLYGYLFNSEGTQIAADDDSGDNRNFKINYTLEANTKYYVAVRPYSSAVGSYTLQVIGNLQMTTPVLEKTEQTDNSVTLSWTDSSERVSNYILYRNGSIYKYLNSDVKTFTDTNLFSEESYEYYVVAQNVLGYNSENSNTVSATIDKDEEAPSTPTNLLGKTTGLTKVYISWQQSSDNGVVKEYEIYCDDKLIGISTTNSYEYIVETEFLEAEHVFKVKAKDSGNNYSEFSDSYNFSRGILNMQLNESINSSIDYSGEYKYFKFIPNKDTTYIFKSTGSTDVYGYLYDSQGKVLTSNDDGGEYRNFLLQYILNKDKTYYIGVRHYNSTSTGAFGLNVTKIDDEDPTAPSNLTITDSNDFSVTFSWDASTDDVSVNSYIIYRNDEEYKTINATDTLSFTDSDIIPGLKCKYYVVAKDSVGNLSEKSNEIEFTSNIDNESPTKVTNIVNTSVVNNAMKLSWDASTDNYKVKCYYVYLNNELVDTVTTNSCTISNLNLLTKYNVKIVASDYNDNLSEPTIVEEQTDDYGNEFSSATNINIGSTIEGKIDYIDDKDYFKFTTGTAGKYSINLGNASNIFFYRLYKSSNNQSYGANSNSNGVLTFNSLEANTEYYFEIYRYGISDKVNYSVTIVDLIAPTVPSNVNITTQSKDGITLIWDESYDSTGVKEYIIYRNEG